MSTWGQPSRLSGRAQLDGLVRNRKDTKDQETRNKKPETADRVTAGSFASRTAEAAVPTWFVLMNFASHNHLEFPEMALPGNAIGAKTNEFNCYHSSHFPTLRSDAIISQLTSPSDHNQRPAWVHRRISLESKTFYCPVTPNTIFVASDTPAKRKELEQSVIKTFYLGNVSSPNDLQDAVNTVRQILLC